MKRYIPKANDFIRACGILLLTAVFVLTYAAAANATLLDDIKAEIQRKEEEIRRLEADKKQFTATIAQKQAAQKTLKNQIAIITAEIERLRTQQKITEVNIASTSLTIRSIGEQIVQTEANIAIHHERIGELIRVMSEQADEHKTILSLVLRDSAMSSFLEQLAYTDSLESEIYDRTQALIAVKEALYDERFSLAEKKNTLEELKGRLEAENAEKDGQQKKKTQLLAKTRNEETKYKTLLTEAEKQRRDILKDIKELEDKLRHTIDPASIPAFRAGVVAWPAAGIVSQEYGDTKDTGFINDSYVFHNGLDIANDTGTPIRAVRDGTIKAIGNNSPYAYGKWIAVEHDNNLTTLYGHLSGYAKGIKQGSVVAKGQVIAYMGATGYATGPHLHFTVYASNTFITEQRWFGLLPLGGSINPRNYLEKK